MALKQNIFIATVLFVVFLQEGWALTCFVCNSNNDTRCSMEKVPDDLAIDCPDKNPDGKPFILCRKIKQIIDFEVNGLPPDNRVIRSCGWDDSKYKNHCYHRSGFGGRQEVCACDGNKCNGANSIVSSIMLLTSALALMRLTL